MNQITEYLERKRVDVNLLKEIKSAIEEIPEDQKTENTLVLFDRLRNQLFLGSILQDKNCIKQIAYDFDEVILNKNWNVLDDVITHLNNIIQSPKELECENNHIQEKHTLYEKMQWFELFRKNTNNFTNIDGWSTKRNDILY